MQLALEGKAFTIITKIIKKLRNICIHGFDKYNHIGKFDSIIFKCLTGRSNGMLSITEDLQADLTQTNKKETGFSLCLSNSYLTILQTELGGVSSPIEEQEHLC